MIHIHDLEGCAPAPLAHYLKALGILRLVAEQADAGARGWWEGDRFRLATSLSSEALIAYFRDAYVPTPLVAPWNGGTGFYPGDKKAQRAITGIRKHPSPRFDPYRMALSDAQSVVGHRTEAPEKKDKERLLASCLRTWRGPHRQAMGAAVVLSANGSPGYPALFGTGFNDGRLDFTSNFMERLLVLLADPSRPGDATQALLQQALHGVPSLAMDGKGAVGQFFPGGAGGANSGAGPMGDAFTNPWDFVLMLEGSLLLVAGSSRRLDANASARVAAPFAIGANGSGYASASDNDESARGEQWMPLWSQPTALPELARLFAEGRAQVGTRPAREPLDMATAIATLGAARGIAAFARFGYIERNGQSNLAVPLGRFAVPEHVAPELACLNDLTVWLSRLRREARSDHAPASLRVLERHLSDALLQVTQHPFDPQKWQGILRAMADIEAVMVGGSGFNAQPVPALRPQWVRACDDGSAEFRLALAAALQRESIRRHWLPLDRKQPGRFATTGNGAQTRLARDPAVVMEGRSGIDDAIAVVERRLIEAAQRASRHLPLLAAPGACADPSDLAAWLSGTVDADRTLALSRALMALDGEAWLRQGMTIPRSAARAHPPDAWIAIRLALLPWPLPDGRDPGGDPAVFRRLASGDAATAFELARRRLRAKGIPTTVRGAAATPDVARLWAAAMAFPITPHIASAFARRIAPTSTQEISQ